MEVKDKTSKDEGMKVLSQTSQPCLRIENFKNLDKEDEDGIIQVLKKQPIGAGIYITEEFENYREGIYEAAPEKIYTKCARPGLHAILLIGYGIDKDTGKNFWWIQNSWGTSWGHKWVCQSNP
ncbi:Ananain [Camellia lanceoleosa]|uniref:Ananain n=1 Tax=Camellia lanceoleosa TaxID=1840588 RepID=A0ACC0G4H4_9ERIC|nr:Ananain [Camellia lanceoleosa]